ncbi:MAG: TRAP transporter small permease [Desulfarculus sp.]|nr:TRAP transporter small permease [Desulfarculus sp.]
MISRILGLLDRALSWFEEWSLYLCVMVGMISLFINVVLRYGFNYTLAWSEELIREIIIYTTFVGCSAAIKNRSQITIDVLVQLMPRLRTPLAYVSNLAVLAYSVFMLVLGSEMAAQQAQTEQKTILLEIPLVVLYAILPLMGAMMGIRTIQNMWKDYHEARAKRV